MTMKIAKEGWLILCDDIRQERGKLFSLIGVHEDNFVFNHLPVLIPELCFAVFLKGMRATKFKWEITFKLPEGEPTILAGKIGCSKDTLALQIFGGISPVRMTAEGDATLKVRFDDEKTPSLVRTFKIIKKSGPEGKSE